MQLLVSKWRGSSVLLDRYFIITAEVANRVWHMWHINSLMIIPYIFEVLH